MPFGGEMLPQGHKDGNAVFWLQIQKQPEAGYEIKLAMAQQAAVAHKIAVNQLRFRNSPAGDGQLPLTGVDAYLGSNEIMENGEYSAGAASKVEISSRPIWLAETLKEVTKNHVLQLKDGELETIVDGTVVEFACVAPLLIVLGVR